MTEAALLDALRAIAGLDAVRTDEAALSLAANDFHVCGVRPLAMVQPGDPAAVAALVGLAVRQGLAVMPRGGGLSYTGGYTPPHEKSICLDMRKLDRILEISASDMVITVQAGVTWKQIAAALKPLGLRLPFIGTFSGAGATVGGGLSHGALFFGSARYGSAAEIVLGMEVALADGTLLRTGQGALKAGSKPFLRTFGPDLTGLFTHDGGMLGVKTEASLRLIRTPAHSDHASFAFATIEGAVDALCEIARADLAEEVYMLDPSAASTTDPDLGMMWKTAALVARSAGGPAQAVRALASIALGGTKVIPPGHFSVHMTAAGRRRQAVVADLAAGRDVARRHGGRPVAPTIPRVARSTLFQNLDAALGPQGGRWAALNAKVAHSDAHRLVSAFQAMLAPYAQDMAAHGVSCTRLASALGNHCFSFEPVFRWRDSWQPIHRAVVDPVVLASLQEPAPDMEARALVDRLRHETVALFSTLGAASNQIGRTYPFRDALLPGPEALLTRLKAAVDPAGLMNPGVLGFGATTP